MLRIALFGIKQSRRRFFSTKSSHALSGKVPAHATALHHLLRNDSNFQSFQNLIDKTPAPELAAMALSVDETGVMPLELLSDNTSLSHSDRNALAEVLHDSIEKHPRAYPLSRRRCIDGVLRTDVPNENTALIRNLSLSQQMVNQARSVINHSSSHPDLNHRSPREQIEVMKGIKKLRKSQQSAIETFESCDQHDFGNCEEFAYLAVKSLARFTEETYWAYVLSVAKGDHCFATFGSKRLMDPADYYNAEADMVFCDPWTGHYGRYYVDDIKQYIGSYVSWDRPDGGITNAITPYNPGYHQLIADCEFEVSPGKVTIRRLYHQFGLFPLKKPVDIEVDRLKPSVSSHSSCKMK